jgi:hypothetical protein
MPKQPKSPLSLSVADVLAMLRASFWRTVNVPDLAAFRYCALVALMACCHILPGYLCDLKFEHWRPGGRAVIRIRRYHRWQNVPLTPQVIYVVERYLAERERVRCPQGVPRWTSEYLFVTPSGKRFREGRIMSRGLRRLQSKIRVRSLNGLLLRFCAGNLAQAKDPIASRRFRGLTKQHAAPHIQLPKVSEPRLARLARRANPFAKLGRQIESEALAERWLKGKTVVLLRLRDKEPAMPISRPAVAALLAVRWPRNAAACRVLRARLRKQYGEEVEGLLQSGLLTLAQAARLFHTTESSVHGFHVTNYRRSTVLRQPSSFRSSRPPPRPKPDAATIKADTALLRKIAVDRRRRGESVEDAVCRKLIAYYPTVHEMISRRTTTTAQAAAAFGTPRGRILFLRAAQAAGVPIGLAAAQRSYVKIPEEWWDRVRKAASERAPGDGDRAFYLRMLMAGFPGCEPVFSKFCLHLRAQTGTTEAERALIAKLSGFKWSRQADERERQRNRLFTEFFIPLSTMLDSRKIRHREVASLFRVPRSTVEYIRAALKAGLGLDQALRRNLRARVGAGDWAAIDDEHARAPDLDDRSFYFRMRLIHDFPGSEKQLGLYRAVLRGRGTPMRGDDGRYLPLAA